MPDKDVTISVAGTAISASPNSVQVKQHLEKVKWTCAANSSIRGITISFPGNSSYNISLTLNGNSWRGMSKDFPDLGNFKYDVTVDFGGSQEILDPEIIVVRGP